MTDIINRFRLTPPETLPDHSFLSASFATTTNLPNLSPSPLPHNPAPRRKPRKKVNKIDDNFFMDLET